MKGILQKQYSHLIWHDEAMKPHAFLLLRYAEVFEYSKGKVLGLHCWSKQILKKLRSKGIVLYEKAINEPFYILRVDIRHLPYLVSINPFKHRPNVKGKWVRGREKVLAHKIIKYRPKFESEEKENGKHTAKLQ